MAAQVNVRVGVGVLVKDPNAPSKVFAGKRKGSHGAGTLALPGGHLEMYESWEQCAAREVKEEMGVDVRVLRSFGHVTNDPMQSDGKHYITIFMLAEFLDSNATPTNCEPNKCDGWDSYSWQELQRIYDGNVSELTLFGPLCHLIEERPEKVLLFLNGENI
mmetsp:Transcript_579/g.1376  ORF Transcript_579/g.1376 Transcript_579/m.1376 type:complete len:161 (+) Transcript_579:241-723(+)